MKLPKAIRYLIAAWCILPIVAWICFSLLAWYADTGWQDVTNDPSFGQFAPLLGTWKNKVPLQIGEIQGKPHLVETSPRNSARHLQHDVPTGTEITIQKLYYRKQLMDDYLFPVAIITIGPYANQKLLLNPLLLPDCLVSDARYGRGRQEIRDTIWSMDATKFSK